jgi:hypothetical protein
VGDYINPSNGQTKEQWLQENAVPVFMTDARELLIDPDYAPVCLVDNVFFTAAAICYNEREYVEFSSPDDARLKTWWKAPRELLEEWSPGISRKRDDATEEVG